VLLLHGAGELLVFYREILYSNINTNVLQPGKTASPGGRTTMRNSADRFLRNEPLSRHIRIGTGGPAALLAFAHSVEEVRDAVLISRERGWPLMVLGRGSNIIVADEGYCGTMLKLGGSFDGIAIDSRQGTVRAGGGAALMRLGLFMARQGFSDFIYMAGIPGSVGGAVRMNAGIDHNRAIEKDFLRALAFDPNAGTTLMLEKNDLAFGYRSSSLARLDLIILEAVFRLPHGRVAPQDSLKALRALLNKRHAVQPRCYHTFGSTFKNPPAPARSAGWYLDQAGMRGMQVGGARVSAEHANWIVNTGTATTADILGLMNMGRTRVLENFGIHLKEEVIVVQAPEHCPPV